MSEIHIINTSIEKSEHGLNEIVREGFSAILCSLAYLQCIYKCDKRIFDIVSGYIT